MRRERREFFPDLAGKGSLLLSQWRKRGFSGCGRTSRASSRVETGMSGSFLGCSKDVKNPLEVAEVRGKWGSQLTWSFLSQILEVPNPSLRQVGVEEILVGGEAHGADQSSGNEHLPYTWPQIGSLGPPVVSPLQRIHPLISALGVFQHPLTANFERSNHQALSSVR